MLQNAEVTKIWERFEKRRERDARKHREKYDPQKRREAYERAKLRKMEDPEYYPGKMKRKSVKSMEIPSWQSSLLEVPFTCYHCGGRSDDLSTLKSHIKTMHRVKLQEQYKGTQSNNNFMDHMLKINEIVEVQIKEEPDFLVPLDLSKKVQENQVWIKEEPSLDYEAASDPLATTMPKIRVASVAVLKARALAPPLVNTVRSAPPPLFPFGSFVNRMLRVQLRPPPLQVRAQDPLAMSPPTVPPFTPPMFAGINRPPQAMVTPRPRMPNHFIQAAPFLLEVPYICHHCGGRSGDLDTLKTHIETMHNPVLLQQQRQAAEAKRKLLQAIADNKIKKSLKLPKEFREKKEKTVRIKKEGSRRERKIKDPNREKKTKKQKNLENRPFQCPFCDFKATNFPGLVLHAKAMHEKERAQKRLEAEAAVLDRPQREGKKVIKKPFHCLFCDYRGVQQQQVKKHMYAIHAKQKRLQCPFCPHRSAYSENMKWHILSKHKNKCPHCDFRATTKATLLAHEKSNCQLVFETPPPINSKSDSLKVNSDIIPDSNKEEPTAGDSETGSDGIVETESSHVNNNKDVLPANHELENSITNSLSGILQKNGDMPHKNFEGTSSCTIRDSSTTFSDGIEPVIIKQEPSDFPLIKTENMFPSNSECHS